MDEKRSYITEGIILLILSAGSYLAAYFYELGFARHFLIPPEFITLDIRSLLFFGATIISVGFLVYQIVNLAVLIGNFAGEKSNHSGILLYVKKHTLLLTLPSIFWVISGCETAELLRVYSWNLVWMTFDAILPIAGREKFGGYDAALKECLVFTSSNPPPDLVNSLSSERGKRIFFVSMLVFLCFMLSYSAGLGVARRTKEFGVSIEGKVLIRRYAESLVFAELSKDQMRLLPNFEKCSLQDYKGHITTYKVGPFPQVEALHLQVVSAVSTNEIQIPIGSQQNAPSKVQVGLNPE